MSEKTSYEGVRAYKKHANTRSCMHEHITGDFYGKDTIEVTHHEARSTTAPLMFKVQAHSSPPPTHLQPAINIFDPHRAPHNNPYGAPGEMDLDVIYSALCFVFYCTSCKCHCFSLILLNMD